MAALVDFLFSGLGAVTALVVGAIWMMARPESRAVRRFLGITAAAYVVASIFAVPYAIGRLLVLGLHPVTAEDVASFKGPTAIVILGSASVTAEDWQGRRWSTVDSADAARVLEAAHVFQLVPQAWVISSGGPGRRPDGVPSGLTMRAALIDLGVPASRIIVEDRSFDTHDEAVLIAPMLRDRQIEHVILVTSDVHMRRSLGTFRKQGIDPLPAIARNPGAAAPALSWVLPTLRGLEMSAEVAHEYLGIPYYAVHGWLTF